MADDQEWQDYSPPSQESDQSSQDSDQWQDVPQAAAGGQPPYDPDEFKDYDLTKVEGDSALEAGVRGAAHSVIPGLVGLAGAGAGSLLGPLGTIAGGVGGAYVGGKIQSALEQAFLPEEAAKMAKAEEEHPFATGLGEVAGFLPGIGARGASTLVRAAMAGIGGGTDLALGGDPMHALGVAAGSAALGSPTKLGTQVEAAGQAAAQKVGGSSEKFSTLLARNVAERTNNAESLLKMGPEAKAVETASQESMGGSVEGAATPPGENPTPGRPGDAHVDAGAQADAVKTAQNGPGATAAAGTAEAKAPPQSEFGEVGNPQSAPTRTGPGPEEAGKAKVAGEGEVAPKDVNTIPEDQALAMRCHVAEDEAAAAEPKGQYQQQEQPQQPPSTLIKPEAFAREQEAKAAAERSAIHQATADAVGARRAAMSKQAVQGMQEAPAGGGRQPPGGKPPGGEKAAPPEPPPRYAEGEKGTAEKAGETLNRGLDNLGRVQNADFYDFTNRLKKATQSAATLLGKGGEDIYHAIEQGKYNELPEALRKRWEDFSGDIKKEIKDLEGELAKRKIKPPETDDPNHIHRVRNMPFSWKDWLNNDPVSALKGMVRPDVMKPREYRGAEAADGSRITLQDMSPTKYAVWKEGEQHVYNAPQREENAKGFKNGDKIEYNGKQYTVDGGRTSEIEQHVRDENGQPIKYKKNAALSLYEHRAQLKAAVAYDDMLRTFKSDKALDPYRVRASSEEGQTAIKNKGFVELHGEPFKDFEGIAMHPDLAQAIRNNFEPGLGIRNNPIVNAMRAINQFAVRSIFWNPVPHSMNSLLHYVVARGEDWLPFKYDKDSYLPTGLSLDNYRRLGESWKQAANVFKAYYDVCTQGSILKDLNQSGVPLVQSSRDRANAHDAIGGLLDANLKAEPKLWAGWAQKFGLGKGVDAVRSVYDASGKALWAASDAMMAARVYELEAKGLTREEAIGKATVHMPDYVLPVKLFGIRGAPSTLSDPSVFMFGRYHVKVLDSLAHMAMDAVGPKSTVEERRQAFGNIMAVGVLATVVYPALDSAVKSITSNGDAEVRRRGPLAPITNVKEAVAPEEGKPPRTYSSAISNLATLSPMIRTMKEALLDNRDWRGKAIIEPASPFYKQAGQLAEYLTKSAVSPYGTAEAATGEKGPGIVSTLAQQVTDTKVPTEEQVSGQAKAAKSLEKQALRREKKPQGFIEQGLSKLSF